MSLWSRRSQAVTRVVHPAYLRFGAAYTSSSTACNTANMTRDSDQMFEATCPVVATFSSLCGHTCDDGNILDGGRLLAQSWFSSCFFNFSASNCVSQFTSAVCVIVTAQLCPGIGTCGHLHYSKEGSQTESYPHLNNFEMPTSPRKLR